MNIRRIIPNIPSRQMEESRKFYEEFLSLKLVMNMEWILTFASVANETAQVSIVKSDKSTIGETDITISIEVDDIDSLYQKALSLNYKIPYPITNEPWGVRRFFVSDPNGVIINIMHHLP